MTENKARPEEGLETIPSKKKSLFGLGRKRASSASETALSLDLGWCNQDSPTPSVVSLEEEASVLMQLEGGLLGLPVSVVDAVTPKPSLFLSRLHWVQV